MYDGVRQVPESIANRQDKKQGQCFNEAKGVTGDKNQPHLAATVAGEY